MAVSNHLSLIQMISAKGAMHSATCYFTISAFIARTFLCPQLSIAWDLSSARSGRSLQRRRPRSAYWRIGALLTVVTPRCWCTRRETGPTSKDNVPTLAWVSRTICLLDERVLVTPLRRCVILLLIGFGECALYSIIWENIKGKISQAKKLCLLYCLAFFPAFEWCWYVCVWASFNIHVHCYDAP